MLAVSMVGPVFWLCCAMLVNSPNGYAEMGIYNAANQWFTVVIFLPGVLGQVLLPVLSESMGSGMIERTRKASLLSVKFNAQIVLPPVICCSLASPWIMEAYGPGFGGAWLTLVIVLLTAATLSVLAPIGQLLVAGGRVWTGFSMNFGWGVAFYGLTILLVDRGANGVATARLLAYLLHSIWTVAFALWYMRSHTEKVS
jgi:O-antigen/teichoic acid export membrane protein